MTLALDAGNSALKAALFSADDSLVEAARFPWSSAWTVALRTWLAQHPRALRAGLASVVATHTAAIEHAIEGAGGPELLRIHAQLPLPLRIAYATPHTLGVDRLVAALAAWTRYGTRGPLVVLDAGTALTYEVVDAHATYLGGAIAPGPDLLLGSLHRGTARLPDVPFELPDSPIGTSTTTALQAGAAYGFIDGVAGMLRRIEAHLGSTPFVVATGGYGAWIADHVPGVDAVRPHLVLEGIRDAVRWQERP